MGNAYHDMVAGLLICLLCFVILLSMLITYLALRWRYLKSMNVVVGPHSYMKLFGRQSPMSPLRRPMTWLAIHNPDLRAVQSALCLSNPMPCPLSEGLVPHNDEKLFISPPISGWILVVGPSLPDPSDDADICFRFITSLSRKLGQVQYFKINPVLDHHAWVRAEFGKIIRGYAWAGKTIWNQGELSAAEKELRLKCYDYCETPEFSLFDLVDPRLGNLEKIHQLAARWSIDPDSIDERFMEHRQGVVGLPAKLI